MNGPHSRMAGSCRACGQDITRCTVCGEKIAPHHPDHIPKLTWQTFGADAGAKSVVFYDLKYIITKYNEDKFELCVSYPGYETKFRGPRFHPSLQKAKDAAQADFTGWLLELFNNTAGEVPCL